MPSLHAQQLLLDRALDVPEFHYSVDMLRRARLCPSDGYLPPSSKVPSFLDQHSPLGHTRIVADATSIQDHISRACDVESDVRRDPWASVPLDLAASVRFVLAHAGSPQVLSHKRHVVDAIIKWVAAYLRGRTDRVFALAPPHVLSLPSRHHVAFIVAELACLFAFWVTYHWRPHHHWRFSAQC